MVKDREAWSAAVRGLTKSWTDFVTEKQQQDNVILMKLNFYTKITMDEFLVCSHAIIQAFPLRNVYIVLINIQETRIYQ